MLAKIIDEETKKVIVGAGTDTASFIRMGMTEMEVEQAWTGDWYVKGYIPEKSQEVKEKLVREVRSQYYAKYVDWYQSKPLLWEELDEPTRTSIIGYRQYLKDYTSTEGWYNKNPLTYEEWQVSV